MDVRECLNLTNVYISKVLVSSISVKWQVEDEISYIKEQFLSLVPEEQAVQLDTPSARVCVQLCNSFRNVRDHLGALCKQHVSVQLPKSQ